MHSGYQKTPPEVHRQHWLDMVGRVPMSACAGQRLSGEASGWVRWSSSRTGWNHGLCCSHGVESSQPGQQGSMIQQVSTISSTVALSVSAARLEAAAQLEGDSPSPLWPCLRRELREEVPRSVCAAFSAKYPTFGYFCPSHRRRVATAQSSQYRPHQCVATLRAHPIASSVQW